MRRANEIVSVGDSRTHQDATGPKGAGDLVDNYIKVEWRDTTAPGSYFIVASEGGARKAIGKFEIPPGGHKGRIFVPVDAEGSFVVAGGSSASDAERSIGLFTRPSPSADLGYHAATTAVLGESGTRVSCISRPRREGTL